MDRRLEHLNRLAKDLLSRAGHQNLTDALTEAIGNSIRPMHDLGRDFDRVSSIPLPKTYIDRDTVNEEDEGIMLQILLDAEVFTLIPGRFHAAFKGIRLNPFDDLNVDKFRKYVKDWGRIYRGYQKGLYSRMYPVS